MGSITNKRLAVNVKTSSHTDSQDIRCHVTSYWLWALHQHLLTTNVTIPIVHWTQLLESGVWCNNVPKVANVASKYRHKPEIGMLLQTCVKSSADLLLCLQMFIVLLVFSQDSGYQHSYRRGGGRQNSSGKNTSSNSEVPNSNLFLRAFAANTCLSSSLSVEPPRGHLYPLKFMTCPKRALLI